MTSTVGIEGERYKDQDVRSSNGILLHYLAIAASAVANIVKSSLGPQGLDKMIVDDIGEVLITNDGIINTYLGATILKKLEVEHPAANLLVQLSQLQDSEVGDGTTSVVILAAELLKRANELIKMKVHPTNIIQGYKMAAKQACKYIEDTLSLSSIY